MSQSPGVSGLVTGAGNAFGASLRAFRHDRYYAGQVAPTVARNGFAAPTVVTFPPGFEVKSAGAIIENNKVWEAAIEKVFVSTASAIEDNELAADTDFDMEVACNIYAFTGANGDGSRALVNARAFAGIHIYSPGLASYAGATSPSGAFQLRQRLDDFSQWELAYYPGAAAAAQVATFTVPLLNTNGPGLTMDPNYSGGHSICLKWKSRELVLEAIVDAVVRASLPVANPNFNVVPDNVLVGAFISSGTQSAACSIFSRFSAFRVTNYATQGQGLI